MKSSRSNGQQQVDKSSHWNTGAHTQIKILVVVFVTFCKTGPPTPQLPSQG